MSFENRERIVSDMFFYFKRLVYYFVKSTKKPKDFKLLYSFTVSSGHKVIWGVTYLHFSCLFCITLDSEMQDDFFFHAPICICICIWIKSRKLSLQKDLYMMYFKRKIITFGEREGWLVIFGLFSWVLHFFVFHEYIVKNSVQDGIPGT